MECISLPTFKKILNNEVSLLKTIKHTNIIQLIDYNCEGETIIKNSGKCIQIFFIVLELVEQGDLFSFIEQKNEAGGFSEKFARYYFTQMLDAIEYLHRTAGVVHRDLKPENLLLSHDYQLKIADFGLSARREGENGTGIHYSTVGTRQYQAPEVLEHRSYKGDRVDIFSMGIILFTMVTGAMPYLKEASVEDPLYKLVVKNDPASYWLLWHHIRSTPADPLHPQISDDLMAEQSFFTDLKDAVKGCLGSLYSSVALFLWYIG